VQKFLQSQSVSAKINSAKSIPKHLNPKSEIVMQTENQTISQDTSVSASEDSCPSQTTTRIQPSCFFVTLLFAAAVLGILAFVMVKIIPKCEEIFCDFDAELPVMTIVVITASNFLTRFWCCLFLLVPLVIWLFIKRHKIPVGILNLLSLLLVVFSIVGILIGVFIFIACLMPLLVFNCRLPT